MSIRETPPCTTLTVTGAEPTEYRSVPGRATSDRRRIDISAGADIVVTFYRLRPGGPDAQTIVGRFVLANGVPLLWPVPASTGYEDVLVVLDALIQPDDDPVTVSIGDHWATS